MRQKEQDDQCEFKPVINERGVKRTFDDLVNWQKSKNQKIHQEQIKEITEAKNLSNTYKAKKIPINEKFRDVIQKHLENKFLEQEDFGERLYSYNDYYSQRKKDLENKIYSQNHVPSINKEYPVESTIKKVLATSLERVKKQKEKDYITLNSSYQTGYLQQNTQQKSFIKNLKDIEKDYHSEHHPKVRISHIVKPKGLSSDYMMQSQRHLQ